MKTYRLLPISLRILPLFAGLALAPNAFAQNRLSAVAASAQNAIGPAASQAIDPTKCLDMKAAEKTFKDAVLQKIRSARTGLNPATTYEGASSDKQAGSSAQAIDARASQQASMVASQLFAALAKPNTPADAASEKASGDSKRRVYVQYFSHCPDQGKTPALAIENKKSYQTSCPSFMDNPDSVGINLRQVYETDLQPQDVMTRLMRYKVTSHDKVTAGICRGNQKTCANQASYSPINPASLNPEMNKDYYVQTVERIYAWDLVLRDGVRVSPENVCGAKVFVITSIANGHTYGFDRSQRVEVVARVGNKTLVLNDISAQTWDKDAFPLRAPAHPDMVQDDIFGKVENGRLVGGYSELGDVVGSKEHPINGEIGGGGSAPPSNAAARQSALTAR